MEVLLKVKLFLAFGFPSTCSSYCPLNLSNHVGFLYEARIKKRGGKVDQAEVLSNHSLFSTNTFKDETI